MSGFIPVYSEKDVQLFLSSPLACPSAPSLHDVFEYPDERYADIPIRIVPFHLAQIGYVTYMVAFPVLIDMFIAHFLPGQRFDDLECLDDRTGISPAPAQVIDLAAAQDSRRKRR
jgi:hypothetical protein